MGDNHRSFVLAQLACVLMALVLATGMLAGCTGLGTGQETPVRLQQEEERAEKAPAEAEETTDDEEAESVNETTSEPAATAEPDQEDVEAVPETEPADETDATAEPAAFSSWTKNSATLETLVKYVEAACDETGADYIPPEDRIAVFDLDGTLMCETYPWCFEYMVFADYALNNPDYKAPEQVAAVAQEILDSAWGEKPEGMSTRQASVAALAYAGMTPDELAAYVQGFKSTKAEGFSGMTRGEAWYRPMLELVSYLQENDFEIYVVTATERTIVRAIVDGTLDIDPAHVIGTGYGYKATYQGSVADGDYSFQSDDVVVFDGSYEGENAKMCKVDAIVREIGQQPVLAFGNSSGDVAMMRYTIANNEHPAMACMVLADDEEREYGEAADAVEERATWEGEGFQVISMKDDFATIYGDGVTKTPVKK